MSLSVFRPRVAALPLAVLSFLSGASHAQVVQLGETVVTATRLATRADELVSEVEVIDRAAIEASTARTLPELLARTAGVQMSATGGRGKTSNVFVRGTENRHTILLVDGVRLASASAGTPTWEAIPVEMIERIEILKGPASALYGSDGVGGVVQVFTRRGREGQQPYASLTAGTDRHWTAGAGVAGGAGAVRYAVGLQRQRERGFNATQPHAPFGNFNPDVDPYRQDAVNLSYAVDLTPGWQVDTGLVHTDGIGWFDDGPGVDARTALRALTTHAGLRGRVRENWRTELRIAYSHDTSNLIAANFFPGAFETRQTLWTWQNELASPVGTVVAGLERRVQGVEASTAFTVGRRDIESAYLGLNGSAGPHAWQLNARRDRNSQFGDADTWFAGYGYRITPQWRVHASHGTSFVAPSFNQLYYPDFGNPALQPEEGRNTDLGVTWTSGPHEVKLVRFDNRIRGFMTNTTLPQNIPRVRIDGWTLAYDGRFDTWSLRAGLDSLDPRNESNGRQLPRRAKLQATLGADWRTGDWTLGGSLLHVGKRFDDTANALPLPAYTTLDLYADWRVARDWTLQAKVNNVTDRHYETAYGYNQPGRGVFLTVRWQPK